ncbi:MAG TPA: insulinase family protein [Candidatus Saccharimonadales bacterium]
MRHSLNSVDLSSGSKGFLIDVPGSTVVNMEFTFLSGFDFVEPDKYEVPHSMEHMLFGANQKFKSAQTFSRELGLNGAYHNAYTSGLLNGYVAETAEFEWERVMELFWLGLTTPKFLPREYKTESETINEELHSLLDNRGLMLNVALMRAMGNDHLQDFRKRIEILPSITTADLQAHHQLTHNASNMRFIIAGNLRGQRERILKLIERYTNNLPNGERKTVPKAKLIQPLSPVAVKRDVDKVYFDLKCGFYGELNEREQVALDILRHILTEAWDSRIFGKGRRKGLLYGIMSSGGSSQGISGFSIAGSVVKSKSKAMFEFVADELCKLKDRGISPAELKRAKQHLIGDFQIRHQTPQSLINWYSRIFVEDDYHKFNERADLIKSITRRDIDSLVNSFFSESNWGVGVLAPNAQEAANRLYEQGERIWA